ncbi:MAG: phage tail protein, partial [Desulfovibrio sp.]|nr:phage tail protein [Desulfovibrio sp.]
MPAETVTTAQEYYCRLTNAGAALEATAHAAAKPVVLTHVAVGDGNGEVPAPAATATTLVHEVYRRQ